MDMKESLYPWDKSYFIMVMILLMYYWIHFASMFISDIGLKFYFFVVVVSLSGFGKADGGLVESLWKCSFLCIFGNSFRRIDVNFESLIEFAWETIWSWTSVCWKFLHHSFNFSYL